MTITAGTQGLRRQAPPPLIALRVVPVPYGSRPKIRPARAWTAWKEAVGLDDPDGCAWRCLLNRWHTVMEGGLQPESVGDIVTRAGERAGIEIRFTGHSPRHGLATASRLKGHDQIVIAKQGGWAPRTPRSWPAASKSSTSGRTRTTPCSACCRPADALRRPVQGRCGLPPADRTTCPEAGEAA